MVKLASVVVITVLALSGCAVPAGPPASEETVPPSPAETSSVPPIASLTDLADTRWFMDDSDGERVPLYFGPDGTVEYSDSGQRFAYPEDTWSVDGDVLTWQVTFGARYGIWTCVATFDAASQTFSGQWTSTVGESGTLELTRPVR
jgi:hypothetical protein